MTNNIEKLNQWKKQQISLQSHLRSMNVIDFTDINALAGMDCAYWRQDGRDYGVCAYQIFIKETGEIIEENTVQSEIEQDYIPGFLYYREHILMDLAYQNMKHKPDIICIDGNGALHPRFMGEAMQFGILNDIPTVGIAKNLYQFEELTKKEHELYYQGFLVGKEILLNQKAKKYAYISAGYRVRLETAVNLTIHMQKFSQPSKYSYITKGSDHIAREYLKPLLTLGATKA